MFARIIAAVTVVLALSAPAWAADRKDLQVARDVSKQVLTYPQFSIFDSVHMQINEGVVTLTGKVTMPYKKNDLEKRVAKIDGVHQVVNQIDRASGVDCSMTTCGSGSLGRFTGTRTSGTTGRWPTRRSTSSSRTAT